MIAAPWAAIAGLGIGTAFTTFSIYTIWIMIRAVTPVAGSRSAPGLLVGLLFVFKLPALVVCVLLIVRLGTPALAGFVTGIILVYSALIWRVQSARQR